MSDFYDVVTIQSLHHFLEEINILHRGIGRCFNALGFKATHEEIDLYKKVVSEVRIEQYNLVDLELRIIGHPAIVQRYLKDLERFGSYFLYSEIRQNKI